MDIMKSIFRSKQWKTPLKLNQKEGMCAAYALTNCMAAKPYNLPLRGWMAEALFERAKKLDRIPGESYVGTDLQGVMQAGKEMKWFEHYRTTTDLDDIIDRVFNHGPVIFGFNRRSNMFSKTTGEMGATMHGQLPQGGYPVDNHVVTLSGFGKLGGYFTALNTYGPKWERGGCCYIHRDYMETLLREGAEVAIPLIEV